MSGELVPIPTRPDESMRMRSVLATSKLTPAAVALVDLIPHWRLLVLKPSMPWLAANDVNFISPAVSNI